MLTRIEIDGFKTFRDFQLDIPPFLVVLGRNASGKSNLFDAIQWLRLVSERTILDAAAEMRGDVSELFHRYVDGSRVRRMSFAVEVLLAPSVTDAFGDTKNVTHSRLRYELTVELRSSGRTDRPFVAAEDVRLIKKSGDPWLKRSGFEHGAAAIYSSRGTPPLETRLDEQGRPVFRMNQDGRQGRPRLLPAVEATATVLSSLTTTTEFPLLFALKQELQSWRLLQLDPAALRMPSSFDDADVMATNGAHLANALRRLVDETSTADRPTGDLADLAADLAGVIPEVVGVRVDEDNARRQRHIEVDTRGEAPFSARVASDGTLRAIALLAALYDPTGAGLICFEEPENGLFPRRLADFLGHLRGVVQRAWEDRATDPAAPLTQLLFSSHSPTILQALSPVRPGTVRDDVVFIDTVSRVNRRSEPKSRVSRIRRIATDPQASQQFGVGELVSHAEIDEFEVRGRLDAA